MKSSDDTLDLEAGFSPKALSELRDPQNFHDAGDDPCSWKDYFAFLDEVRPSREQLLEVNVYDRVFSLE